ncbi:hypothetical protein HAX54_034593 [Datura stramonium]|uniref:Uncharacterized protein n=1 Tax=Datura stramonium TaxID=4076 RepID=A0ABS8VH25_DATST|nr:hypothetical protein [Datura stramonium]
MDFHSLTRRELQALCKKNKIPANMTNVSMADALQSLEFSPGKSGSSNKLYLRLVAVLPSGRQSNMTQGFGTSTESLQNARNGVRLAGKSMQESSTQEDEKSGGTLTFDAVSEETDESLEVDYVHKTEELNKNDTKAKEGSEEGSLGQNNNGGSEEVSGAEPIEESEIDAEAKRDEEFLHKNQSMGDDSTRNSDITNHGSDQAAAPNRMSPIAVIQLIFVENDRRRR